jgi:fructose-1,6-bisphosphatase/inositol monophosphatase family enzyme
MAHDIPIDDLRELLHRAAETEIMPRFGNLSQADIRMKSEAIDLVTEADEAAERLIRSAVSSLMPEALFIGEEAVAADPSLLEKIADADLTVIVDPVDGTFNFANGVPLFGVMLAVVKGGETVAGLILDPFAGDCHVAEKGAGAFAVRRDGQQTRLKLADALPVADMLGASSTGYFHGDERSRILANLAKVRATFSYRCAAHEYRLLAKGGMQFAMYNKLMPWDHLAGALLTQEAGGHVARFDGSPYLPVHTGGGLLAAPDADSWHALRDTLFPQLPLAI